MGERKVKHSRKRRLSDEDWCSNFKQIKKIKKTRGTELKIVLRKINLSQLKCSDGNKENDILDKTQSICLTPRLNLCRIDAMIPNASKSLSSLKIDDDKKILLRQYTSSETSQSKEGFETVTTHNMVSVSSKSFAVPSEGVTIARNKNEPRNIFTDLKNVETSIEDSLNNNEGFLKNCEKSFHDKVDSVTDTNKNASICTDEKLMKPKMLAYDNGNSYREIHFSQKKLIVNLQQLKENRSTFFKTYVKNKYLEADSRKKKIIKNWKPEKMIGIDFYSKESTVEKEATKVIMESYTETIKDFEVPAIIQHDRAGPPKINHGDFEVPAIRLGRGRPRKIHDGNSNDYKNPLVNCPAVRDAQSKSNSDSSKGFIDPVSCRTRGKYHKDGKNFDVPSSSHCTSVRSCENNHDSNRSHHAMDKPRKSNSGCNKNVEVSPVSSPKKSRPRRSTSLPTRFKNGNESKNYSESTGVKLPPCKSKIKKQYKKKIAVPRKKIVEIRIPAYEIITRRKAAAIAASEGQTNVRTSQMHKKLYHHMEIEETTTVTKKIKSEESQNLSFNSSILVLHSTKNNVEPKKKLNVSFHTPNAMKEVTLKSIFNSSLILKRCEIPASSTPYLEKSKKKRLNLNVTLKDEQIQKQIDLEDESGNEFEGFTETKISPNGITFVSSKKIISSSKSKRFMSRKEADEKTEFFNLCKKAMESSIKNLKNSKRVAVKKIDLDVNKAVIRTSRRLALKKMSRSSPIRNVTLEELSHEKINSSSPVHNVTLEDEKVETIKKAMMTTPYVVLNKLSYADISSYKITPLREDRIPIRGKTKEDYGIDDVNTDDSTDNEDFPKKRIPEWAQGMKDGVLETFQSFLSRDLVQRWMKPPNYRQPMLGVFFNK